ncbi:MAG TPA: OsmC family protein [Tenuifilaceae bacterium]|nr:OsmC family protein [Tenuifilaceae bacterium]HPI43653.1 OsmC family protein [Tenuifilaceae bacterium]HPN21090.1 OsmC family protein [Tenuifilaceae bacterium]HPV56148.1 OsmC family protein [Tenuifilaceae bacterium]HSA04383.1 OsmC family protein [Tenuifilaceae bacterium]
MKSTSLWTRQFQSVVDNGRNHSMVIDLPEAKGGINSGPTALEMCVMSFSGCVGTIFAMVAQKMRLTFEHLEVEVNAEQKNEAPTITDIHFIMNIKTIETKDKIEKCLEHTMNTCPVGVLFKQAGVKITNEIKFI